MPLSYAQYQGDGSQQNFDVPCEYLSKSHISVKVDGVDVPFVWIDTYRLFLTTPPAPGTVVEVRRTTPREDRLVTFTDGSTLVETDLNTSTLQSFFLAQEAFDQGAASMSITEDGQFSAGDRRISNVAPPVLDNDVVTKSWAMSTVNTNVGAAIQAKDQATEARNAANAHRASAANERTQAETARTGSEEARDLSIAAKVGSEVARDASIEASNTAVAARSASEVARDEANSARTDAIAAKSAAEAARHQAEEIVATVAEGAVPEGFMRRNATNDGWEYLTAEATRTAIGALSEEDIPEAPSGLVDVKLDDFNAVGNGTTDDRAAFLAAFAALGASGGRVLLGRDRRYRVSTLEVPKNIQLIGPYEYASRPGVNIGDVDYMSMGAILVDGTGTITLRSNSGLHGCLIRRTGQGIPAAGPTGWVGTAITAQGDDIAISRCSILTFAKAIAATSAQRIRITDLSIDCLAGIDITDTWDIPYIARVHCWPFATIHHPSDYPYTYMIRSGYAFHLHDGVDWAKLTDCFAYGYAAGFVIMGASSTTLLSCSADNAWNNSPQHSGSFGFIIGGTSLDTRLIGCQAAAQADSGVYVGMNTASQRTFIDGLTVWGGSSHGILVGGAGTTNIVNSSFRDVNNVVSLENNVVQVSVTNSTANGVSGDFINCATSTVVRLLNNDFRGVAGKKLAKSGTIHQQVLTDPVMLPTNHDTVVLTGDGSFGQLHGCAPGRRVTLIFTGAGTIWNSNAPNGLAIRGGGNHTFQANGSITFVSDGDRWFET